MQHLQYIIISLCMSPCVKFFSKIDPQSVFRMKILCSLRIDS